METTKESDLVAKSGKRSFVFLSKCQKGRKTGLFRRKPNHTVNPQQFVTVQFSKTDKAAIQRAPFDQRPELFWINKTSGPF